MKWELFLLLESDEMGWWAGDERNISQNEGHGEEMDEMGEIFTYKPLPISIPFLIFVIKKSSLLPRE